MNSDEFEDKFKDEYAKGKAKFYANPRFAGMVGFVVGGLSVLILQWLF